MRLLLVLLAACSPADPDVGVGPAVGGVGPDAPPDEPVPVFEDTGLERAPPGPACIAVDGVGSFDSLAAAVAFASPGALITLCEGTWTESVTVDKAVTVRGVGNDATILVGTRGPALTVHGDDVEIEQLQLTGERGGLFVTGDGALLTDLHIDAGQAIGLSVDGGSGLVLTRVAIERGVPAVSLLDAGVELHNLTLVGSTGVAMRAERSSVWGAVITVDRVHGTPEGGADGLVFLEAEASLEALTVVGVRGTAIRQRSGSLVVRGASLTGGGRGIEIVEADRLVLERLVTEDQKAGGVWARGVGEVYVADASVRAAEGTFLRPPHHASWLAAPEDSTGFYLEATTVLLRDVLVEGYAGAGLVLKPHGGPATALLDGVTLRGQRHLGAWLEQVHVTATATRIEQTQTLDGSAPDCDDRATQEQHAALVVVNGRLEAGELTVVGSEAGGVVTRDASVELTGTTLEGMRCAALSATGGALLLDGLTSRDGASSGLQFWASTQATLLGVSVDRHLGYGMRCDASASVHCAGVVLRDNLLGPVDGCPASCGAP
jgi:hypothetical protein